MGNRANAARRLGEFLLFLCLCMGVSIAPSCTTMQRWFAEPSGTIYLENIEGVALAVIARTRTYAILDASLSQVDKASLDATLVVLENSMSLEQISGQLLSSYVAGILDTHDAYLFGDASLSPNALAIRLEDSARIRSVLKAARLGGLPGD